MAHRDYTEWGQVQNFLKEAPNWSNTVAALKQQTDGVVVPSPTGQMGSMEIPSQAPTMSGGNPLAGLAGKLVSNVAGKMPIADIASKVASTVPGVADIAKSVIGDSNGDRSSPETPQQPSSSLPASSLSPSPSPASPPSPSSSPSSSPPATEKDGGAVIDLSKQEVVGNIFTYVYLFLAGIGIMATLSILAYAWIDLHEINNYKRVMRPNENMLLFKDTIEHEMLSHNRFNVFTENKGSINIAMSMGVHMLSMLLVQTLLCIIIKIALDGGNWTDAVKGFKNVHFLVIMLLFVLQLMFVLIYYFQFNRRKFNGSNKSKKDNDKSVLGKFNAKLKKMDELRSYITKNLYNYADNITFYGKIVSSVHDHGRAFKAYLADQVRKNRNSNDIAKMMFTFNVFNFYLSQYNTVENFVNTDIYRYFASSPSGAPDVDIIQYINVLGVNGGGIMNIFSKTQVTLWYNRMYPDRVQREIAMQNSWEHKHAGNILNEKMTIVNSMLVSTMMEFNWTQYLGTPSHIFKTFKEYLVSRFLYWFFLELLVIAVVGTLITYGVKKSLSAGSIRFK